LYTKVLKTIMMEGFTLNTVLNEVI